MQSPIKIVFRGMEPSPAVEARIRERASRLDQYCDRVTSCDVAIEAPHQHQYKGKLYVVRLQVRIPGSDIAVNRAGPRDHAHEDVYVALRDAFDAAERQLKDTGRRRAAG
jgi:ribosomal subunit interface protein